jgi:hypothetical protein
MAQVARRGAQLSMRKVAWISALVLLLGSAMLGLNSGIRELGEGETLLQRTVPASVVLYGVFGLVAGVGLARRRSWAAHWGAAWALALVYAAAVASFAYHDPTMSQDGTFVGITTAGVATALVGAYVVWVARREARDVRVPSAATSGHIPPT